MAFSEHFLGASLIATPLQWLGFSPVAAYNVTFLVSFPLSGAAAHFLGYTLTRRHDAAFVGGLVYGFNPYRVAHIEHLELLLAFGMPVALGALHRYVESRRRIWLAAFAAALIIQVLSGSYYALFFTVLVALWVIWFLRPRAWRDVLAIAGAAGVAAVVVSPIVIAYSRIHDDYNLRRDFTEEVLKFSGDVSSLVTASPLSALWGWTAPLNGGERQLFPGLTVIALIAAAMLAWRQSAIASHRRQSRIAVALWLVSIGLAGVALWARMIGPWAFERGWLGVSVHTPYKPLSLAVFAALGAVLVSPAFGDAWRRRSLLTFYLLAAAALFVCALGPRPSFLGEQVLYEPPYAWLMRLPFFDDTVRVPSRFAMLGVLALSAAGALAFARLAALTRHRMALASVVVLGVLADGWIRSLPLPAVPPSAFQIPDGTRPAAVLELPLGDVWRDSAAMYRATLRKTPAVNGYNGYEPSFYQVLRRALDERDDTILDALAGFGPLLIASDARVDPDGQWPEFLLRDPGVRPISKSGPWRLFHLGFKPPPASVGCDASPVTIAAAFDTFGPVPTTILTDGDPLTGWTTRREQRAGDALLLDLGRRQSTCKLTMTLGDAAVLYPGRLRIATSLDRSSWETVFDGRLGGATFRAALADPRDSRLSIPLRSTAARYVRLQVGETSSTMPWAITGLELEGSD